MADIRVERKGRTIWPWIIGLVVLALLVWALMELLGRNEPEAVEGEPVAGVVTTGRLTPSREYPSRE